MKIFILTEGGKNKGMGHISRCLSLYQAFESKGYSSQLIVSGDSSILMTLQGTDYLRLEWINKPSEILSIVNKADIIIIDSYYCPLDLYHKFANRCKKAIYIDDNIRIEYPEGIVINGVMCGEKLNYPKTKNITYLLGQDYAFLRKDFWDVPIRKINKEINSIMIMVGSNDINGLSFRILKSIIAKFPKAEKTIVLYNGETPYLEYFNDNSTVYFDLTSSEMKAIMIKSDIAISAAGQTTYELCRVGTPFVAINTADNQSYSINCFKNNGLIRQVIQNNDSELKKKILLELDKLSDYHLRKAISQKMQKSITGKGPLTVIEYLLQNFHKNS